MQRSRSTYNPYVYRGKVTREGLDFLDNTETLEVVTSDDGFFEHRKVYTRSEWTNLWLKGDRNVELALDKVRAAVHEREERRLKEERQRRGKIRRSPY